MVNVAVTQLTDDQFRKYINTLPAGDPVRRGYFLGRKDVNTELQPAIYKAINRLDKKN